MSQRICFYKNKSQLFLKGLVCECLNEFKEWYLNIYLENEEKDNYVLYKHLNKIIDLNNEFNEMEQELIDEITAEFIGTFLDIEQQNYIELVFPFVNKIYYIKNTEDILKTEDSDFIKLWDIIIKGRSIKNNKFFDGYTNNYKIGFLSKSEYLDIKEKIEKHFTNKIKKDNGFGLVLQAIENMNLCKEMIITIE
jgi:hypothetical protein